MQQQRKRLFWWLGFALYAITWVGGWITYPRALEEEAALTWWATWHEYRHKGGPKTSMSFCVPVLPGVLLAWTDTSIGMRHRGHSGQGPTVFGYYGCFSATIFHVPVWKS